ncbi:MAG: thioredoxin domain-containing protein [Sandaracinaceae bacterium]
MRVHPAILLLRVAVIVALGFTAATAVEYYISGHTFCEPAGGCDQVKHSGIGRLIGPALPALGLIVFPLLFAGSLGDHRPTLRWVARLAVLCGLGGLSFLLLQAFVIGHYCWLCVGVDLSAIAAAVGGVWMLRDGVGRDDGETTMASYAWPLVFLALSPLAWALTFPDPALPAPIHALWDEDADVNIVEMADFECPHCRHMHPVLREVVQDTEATVHLSRIVVPLGFHQRARPAAAAYFCAEERGLGEEMADRLFTGGLDDAALAEHADALGIDPLVFSACLASDATDARIEADLARSHEAGMAGLPTVYIGERVVLGFREDAGAAPYRAAVQATIAGEGRRTVWWPYFAIAVLSLLSLGLSYQKLRPV